MKLSDLKTGMRFSALIREKQAEGKIRIYNSCVFLCQDVADGDRPDDNNTLGYKYSWLVRLANNGNINFYSFNVGSFVFLPEVSFFDIKCQTESLRDAMYAELSKLGYYPGYNQASLLSIGNCYDKCIINKNKAQYMCLTSHCPPSDWEKSVNIKSSYIQFNIPQQWDEALAFAKEMIESPYWDDIKVGDIVVVDDKPDHYNSGGYILLNPLHCRFPFIGFLVNKQDAAGAVNISGYGFANDVEYRKATPDEIKNMFKVGDYVTCVNCLAEINGILNDGAGFELGKTFKIYSIDSIRNIIWPQNDDGVYFNHVRPATKKEIDKAEGKILYFGDVEFRKKNGFYSTDYGDVTKKQLQDAYDWITNPPKLATYPFCIPFKIIGYKQIRDLHEIAFGCKKGTVKELKALLDALE